MSESLGTASHASHALKTCVRFNISGGTAVRDVKHSPYRRVDGRTGFSLVELITVIAISVILTGLLMPVLGEVRENVHRVVCSSNQRQLGLAFAMYARDHRDALPYSNLLRQAGPGELMAAHQGPDRNSNKGTAGWDGLGLLALGGYCSVAECFYCPSHRGEHTLPQYETDWNQEVTRRIYTNYHYAGDVEWENQKKRRRLSEGEGLVLATDGFRTIIDVNHESGANVLRADNSVVWKELSERVLTLIPTTAEQDSDGGGSDFPSIWRELENRTR